MMMRDEDAGFGINGRVSPDKSGVLSAHPEVDEPDREETERVKANDKLVLEYMETHDHYIAAFNAITWRERATFAEENLIRLAAATLGLDPEGKLPEDVVMRALAERGRLMERVSANETSLNTAMELANRLQRFNMSMVTDVLEGRRALDELRTLATRFGVIYAPSDDAHSLAVAIQAAIGPAAGERLPVPTQ